MWIKLLKAVDGKSIGDVMQVDDAVGKAYTSAGLAEDAGTGPEDSLVKAAVDQFSKAFETFKQETQAEVAKAIDSLAEQVKTPIRFSTITPGESEIEKRLPTGGFKSLGHLCHSLVKDKDAIAEYKSFLTKAPPLGFNNMSDAEGVMVPPEFSNQIWQNAMTGDALWPLCNPISVSGHSYEYQRLKENNRTTSRNGGLLSYWGPESGTLTATSSTFEPCSLRLGKLHVLTYATEEQLEDAPALQSWLNQVVPDEIAFKLNDAIVNGPGGDQPQGILGHAATVSVAKETNQVAATIVRANIHKMVARIQPAKRSQTVWLVNSDTLSQLEELDILTFQNSAYLAGNLGASRSIWTYDDGSTRPMIRRRPVIEVEACATLGTEGDIILAHLPSYLAIQKAGIRSATSIHVQFTTDETAFKWTFRANGQPRSSSTVTAFKGTATYGDFVTVAVRS